MIKLYADYIPLSVPERELQMSWAIQDLGLHIPRAYRLVTDGKRIGVEFERITPKRSFARAISQEPDRLVYYTEWFAKECLKLHATPCNTKVFTSVKDFFNGVIEESRDFDAAQKARLHAFVDAAPDATTCLHGDMHTGNIITDGERTWWIDLADFRYGCPLFDMGMLYFVCIACGRDDITENLFHVSCAAMRQVWDVFVKTYFGPDASTEEVSRLVAPYSSLYMIHLANRESMSPDWRNHIEETLLK
jgi:uncharacterized protein (TIGR02172 family)